jgi:SpoVK/Ycf46/Vps4 family AAA+-type ATPase
VERSFAETFAQLLKARFPVLYLDTYEEQRALHQLAGIAGSAELVRVPRAVWTWSLTSGLLQPNGEARSGAVRATDALRAVQRIDEPAVFVFRDLHPLFAQSPEVVRLVRDIAQAFRAGRGPRTLVLLSPVLELPVELSKDVTVVDFPLPAPYELRGLLDAMLRGNAASGRLRVALDEAGRERFVTAAAGLTMQEAENAYARAMVNDTVLDLADLEMVHDEKRQTVRKSGVLEFITGDTVLDDVGGLENLKAWLLKRNGSWLDEAAGWGLPAPRGVLITGVPGCGKSLTAKAVATAWDLPLLRFDIGRVFAGLVGSSEHNMRTALRTAEAVAPCVLWVDEIEKGLATSDSDDGISRRVLGYLLTWMAERKKPVFLVATANQVQQLPAELLRKGRFDEIFFVDLPDAATRAEIFRLHLKKRKADVHAFDADALAAASDGFSGAEIEQAIVAALYAAHAEQRDLAQSHVAHELAQTRPLSVLMAEQVGALREWARERTVPAD